MASVLMMDRPTVGSSMMGFGAPVTAQTGTAAMPAGTLMLPRCTMRVEKCDGGMKITCSCEDEVACAMLQNLCRTMANGMCSCCCTMNGMAVCTCNMAMAMCKCEYTSDGVCVTCVSGDKTVCEMIQACCECMAKCLDCGCCCYLCFNGTPVCCGTC